MLRRRWRARASWRSTQHPHAIQLYTGRRIHSGLATRKAAKVDLKTAKIPCIVIKGNFCFRINGLHELRITLRASRRRADGVGTWKLPYKPRQSRRFPGALTGLPIGRLGRSRGGGIALHLPAHTWRRAGELRIADASAFKSRGAEATPEGVHGRCSESRFRCSQRLAMAAPGASMRTKIHPIFLYQSTRNAAPHTSSAKRDSGRPEAPRRLRRGR